MLETAASVATIFSAGVGVVALIYQLRTSGTRKVRTSYVRIRGHSSFKRFVDNIVQKHSTVILCSFLAFIFGLCVPQLIIPLGIITFFYAVRSASRFNRFYMAFSVIVVVFVGLVGAYASNTDFFRQLGFPWVFDRSVKGLHIWYLLR